MEEGLEVCEVSQKGVIDLIGGQGRGQGQVTAGDAFGQAHQVGAHLLVLAGEHPAGAAETHRHFIGNEQHVMLAGHFPNLCQIPGGWAIIPAAPCMTGSTMTAANSWWWAATYSSSWVRHCWPQSSRWEQR